MLNCRSQRMPQKKKLKEPVIANYSTNTDQLTDKGLYLDHTDYSTAKNTSLWKIRNYSS